MTSVYTLHSTSFAPFIDCLTGCRQFSIIFFSLLLYHSVGNSTDVRALFYHYLSFSLSFSSILLYLFLYLILFLLFYLMRFSHSLLSFY